MTSRLSCWCSATAPSATELNLQSGWLVCGALRRSSFGRQQQHNNKHVANHTFIHRTIFYSTDCAVLLFSQVVGGCWLFSLSPSLYMYLIYIPALQVVTIDANSIYPFENLNASCGLLSCNPHPQVTDLLSIRHQRQKHRQLLFSLPPVGARNGNGIQWLNNIIANLSQMVKS